MYKQWWRIVLYYSKQYEIEYAQIQRLFKQITRHTFNQSEINVNRVATKQAAITTSTCLRLHSITTSVSAAATTCNKYCLDHLQDQNTSFTHIQFWGSPVLMSLAPLLIIMSFLTTIDQGLKNSTRVLMWIIFECTGWNIITPISLGKARACAGKSERVHAVPSKDTLCILMMSDHSRS